MASRNIQDNSNANAPIDDVPERDTSNFLSRKKEALRKEIKELESLNFQIECNLDTTQFGIDKHVFSPRKPANIYNHTVEQIENVELKLKNELHDYIGFYCVKFTENEYIFNFTSIYEKQRGNLYCVQVLFDNDKLEVGKWVMPITIDMDEILSETPLALARDITPFLRNCKRHIDCYFEREKQFDELKSFVTNLINCRVDTDLGYNQITLQLYGVLDAGDDTSMDVSIYLLYNFGQTRPYKFSFDNNRNGEWNSRRLKQFKLYTKCFRNLELCRAFQRLSDVLNASHIWTMEEAGEDSLNLQDSSEAESESYVCRLKIREKLLSKKRLSRNRKFKLQEKSNNDRPATRNLAGNEGNSHLEKSRKIEAFSKRKQMKRKNEGIIGLPGEYTKLNKAGSSAIVKSGQKSQGEYNQTTLDSKIYRHEKITAKKGGIIDPLVLPVQRSTNGWNTSKPLLKSKVVTSTPFRKSLRHVNKLAMVDELDISGISCRK